MELLSRQIELSPQAAAEWQLMCDAVILYQALIDEGSTAEYQQEVLPDGRLRLIIEIGKGPFIHGMYLVVDPEHWRTTKEDA